MELRSEHLRVTVEEPGSRYLGTRFDWTSQVTSVVLDGRTECLSQELPAGRFRPTKGRGLNCEFGIKLPVGYRDCPEGDWFPKIGVGWLRRAGPRYYRFYRNYELLEPSPWTVSRSAGPAGESLTLLMEGGQRRGYGWQLSRTWSVDGRQLDCLACLENTGNEPIRTNEYCHNFVAPGLGGGMRELAWGWPEPPVPKKWISPDGNLTASLPGVTIDLDRPGVFYANFPRLALPAGMWWELRAGGQPWIRETVDQPVNQCDLWGHAAVISPELFVPVEVAPGQTLIWRRCWRFGA